MMRIFPEVITTEYIISQALGFVALALVCVGYFCRKEKLFVYQIIGNLMVGLSLMFLNATYGWISTLIASLRFVIFYIFQKQNKKIPVWALCLITYLFVSTCAVFGQSNYELLQLFAVITFTYAFVLNNEVIIRIILLISHVLFVAYNLVLQNFFGILRCVVELIVVFVALIYFIKRRKKDE